MVIFQPKLPLRVMYESVAMLRQELVSMSVDHIATREHGVIPGQGSHEGAPGCLETVQN